MYSSFVTDDEKMYDFCMLDKESFLKSYSYLTELEYNLTMEKVMKLCNLYTNFKILEDMK